MIEKLTSFVEESKAKEGQLEKEAAELRAELKRAEEAESQLEKETAELRAELTRAEAEEAEGSPTSR